MTLSEKLASDLQVGDLIYFQDLGNRVLQTISLPRPGVLSLGCEGLPLWDVALDFPVTVVNEDKEVAR